MTNLYERRSQGYRQVMCDPEPDWQPGTRHPAVAGMPDLARGTDQHGREVIHVEWFAAGSTWTELYLAGPEKMRQS